jgi:glycosyltransferase involved in cell wall biosynthesis
MNLHGAPERTTVASPRASEAEAPALRRVSKKPANEAAAGLDIAIFSPLGRDGGRTHGGITRVVINLATAFARAGRRIELVTFSPVEPSGAIMSLPAGVSFYNFPPGSRLRHLLRLRSYLRRRAPRALLAAGLRPNLLAAACKRCSRFDTRVFLSVHNALSPGLGELGPIRRRLRVLGLRRLYPIADGIICVSGGVADDLARVTGIDRERLTVIHNPVSPAATTDSRREAPVHPWFAPGQPPVVLAAGRLTRQKDFATLVRAFAIIAARGDYRLMIIGEGSERAALRRLATELGVGARLLLPGFVDDPLGFMGQAALFVLSSAWEGFGNVLVEAMAAGTPVVSTDCPSGPREILRDGELGPLVPPGDPKALARAMLTTLVHPPDPGRLRERASEFADGAVAERYLTRMFGEGEGGRHDDGG